MDHGGGKRRGGHDHKQKPRYSNSAGLFCKAVKLFTKLNAPRGNHSYGVTPPPPGFFFLVQGCSCCRNREMLAAILRASSCWATWLRSVGPALTLVIWAPRYLVSFIGGWVLNCILYRGGLSSGRGMHQGLGFVARVPRAEEIQAQ